MNYNITMLITMSKTEIRHRNSGDTNFKGQDQACYILTENVLIVENILRKRLKIKLN